MAGLYLETLAGKEPPSGPNKGPSQALERVPLPTTRPLILLRFVFTI